MSISVPDRWSQSSDSLDGDLYRIFLFFFIFSFFKFILNWRCTRIENHFQQIDLIYLPCNWQYADNNLLQLTALVYILSTKKIFQNISADTGSHHQRIHKGLV